MCLAHSEYSDPSDCRHSSKSFLSQFFCPPEAMPFTQLNWFFSPPCIFCNFIVCSKEFYAQQKTVAQYNEQFSFWYLAVKKHVKMCIVRSKITIFMWKIFLNSILELLFCCFWRTSVEEQIVLVTYCLWSEKNYLLKIASLFLRDAYNIMRRKWGGF